MTISYRAADMGQAHEREILVASGSHLWLGVDAFITAAVVLIASLAAAAAAAAAAAVSSIFCASCHASFLLPVHHLLS